MMLKNLFFGVACGLTLLATPNVASAQFPDESEKAKAQLEKAERQLVEARKALESARAQAAEMRSAELAKLRETLEKTKVNLPTEAMEAIEKALAKEADGMSVITLDASGLATVEKDGEEPRTTRFRKRIFLGPDGEYRVEGDGDADELPKFFAILDDEEGGKKEIRVETKAFFVGPDGEMKNVAEFPEDARLPGLKNREGNSGIRMLLRNINVNGGEDVNTILRRFETAEYSGKRKADDGILAELKKLNKRLDAIETRLDKIEEK